MRLCHSAHAPQSSVVQTWTCPDLDRGPGPEVPKVRESGAGPGPAAELCKLWTCRAAAAAWV